MTRIYDHQISCDEYMFDVYPTPYMDFLNVAPTQAIQEAFIKAYPKIREYGKILVSVSGGADSDRMIDLIERIGHSHNVEYHYYNTGMEYQATIDHLNELEDKYGIVINRHKAKMPVPMAVKKYGVPFLSKQVSGWIHRLQFHGFQWEDEPFDVLYKRYPKCKAALRWWCNAWGEGSRLNINNCKLLKEFLIANPPDIPISDICCQKSKKDTAKAIESIGEYDLCVQGVRKAEGGARSTAYKSCFDDVFGGCDKFRPLFWFKKRDCIEYDLVFGVDHSKCYWLYGLSRTGCSCCPYGKNWREELEAAKEFEPKLYKLAMAVFGPSYEYTLKYYKFRDQQTKEAK